MRKMLILALAALLAAGIVVLPAAAATYTGGFNAADGSDAAHAALYSSLPIEAGPSNYKYRTTPFTTEVQVAQWSRWQFLGTKWTWFVRKPGEYYADSIQATIQSNGNVVITFEGFGNPAYLDSNELDGVKREIKSWYGVGSNPTAKDFTGWIAANDLNAQEILIPDSKDLHEGLNFKLWNKIEVCECNSAGIYRNTGVITMTLQNQMPWLDDDGNWNTPNKSKTELSSYVNNER